MTSATVQKFRFADAVFAIECTPKALRKMLENPRLCLPKDESGGWLKFSLLQIALLAVARRFIEFGMPIEQAAENAAGAIFAPLSRSRSGQVTAEKLLALLSTTYVVVEVEDGQQRIRVDQERHWSELKLHLDDRPSLILHIGPIVQKAFRRAVLGSDEWQSEDAGADLLAAIKKMTISLQDAMPEFPAAARS